MRAPFDVLLVEDEPVVREAAARILRPEGLTLDRVEDVDGALARLRRVEHRVVLSDLMLPGFSGFDLLERVTGERPHLPVILITGYATIENALAAFKKGAFDYLPKPFDVAELLGLVLPQKGARLTQGLACAEIATADESIHRIWAPLSGTVLEINPAILADPDLLNRAPFTSGWLARVAPSDLETELDALTRRAGAALAPARNGGEKEKR